MLLLLFLGVSTGTVTPPTGGSSLGGHKVRRGITLRRRLEDEDDLFVVRII